MPGLDDILRPLLRMEGAVCAGVVERDSGRLLGAVGNSGLSSRSAAAVAAVARLSGALDGGPGDGGGADEVEDVMVTSGQQFHLLRQVDVPAAGPVVIYVRLRRGQANPAACRRELASREIRRAVVTACAPLSPDAATQASSARPAGQPAGPARPLPAAPTPRTARTAPARPVPPASRPPAPSRPSRPEPMPLGSPMSSLPAARVAGPAASRARASSPADPAGAPRTPGTLGALGTPGTPGTPLPNPPPAHPPPTASQPVRPPSPTQDSPTTALDPASRRGGPTGPDRVPAVLPQRVRGAWLSGSNDSPGTAPDAAVDPEQSPSVLHQGWVHDPATLRRLLRALRCMGS